MVWRCSNIVEVLALCVGLHRLLPSSELLFYFVGPQRELVYTLCWSAFGVRGSIVIQLLLLGENSNKFDWFAAPDLTSWDQSTWWHD